MEKLISDSSQLAKSNGASASQIEAASKAFNQAISDAVSQGLSAEEAYQYAIGIFWSNVEVTNEASIVTPEQKLLSAFSNGDNIDEIINAIKKSIPTGKDGNDESKEADVKLDAAFLETLVNELASGKTVSDAVLSATKASQITQSVAEGEQNFIQSSELG